MQRYILASRLKYICDMKTCMKHLYKEVCVCCLFFLGGGLPGLLYIIISIISIYNSFV